MTDTEIQIAIAESVGFPKPIYSAKDIRWGGKNEGTYIGNVPNYPSDLNAMHEVWKGLTEAEKTVFAETLFAVTNGEVIDWGYYPGEAEINWNQIGETLNATARQRAEAYLRVKGLWKE